MAKNKKEEQAAPEQTEKKGLEKPNFRENLLGDRAGVNVNFNEEANIYEIKVEPRPLIVNPIRQIEGAEFDKEKKSWIVAANDVEKLKDAVNISRGLNHKINLDKIRIKDLLTNDFKDIGTRDAYTKEGTRTNGAIMEITQYHVVQSTGRAPSGKEYFVIHEKERFINQSFHRNEEKSIVYNKYGKAEVGPRMYKTAEGEYTLDKEKALVAPEPAPESKRGRGGR